MNIQQWLRKVYKNYLIYIIIEKQLWKYESFDYQMYESLPYSMH